MTTQTFADNLSLRTEILILLASIGAEITRAQISGSTGAVYRLLVRRRIALMEQLHEVQDEIERERKVIIHDTAQP